MTAKSVMEWQVPRMPKNGHESNKALRISDRNKILKL